MSDYYSDGAWSGHVTNDGGRVRFSWSLAGSEVAAPTLAVAYARRYALDVLRACADPGVTFSDNVFGDFSDALVCHVCGAFVADTYSDEHEAFHVSHGKV